MQFFVLFVAVTRSLDDGPRNQIAMAVQNESRCLKHGASIQAIRQSNVQAGRVNTLQYIDHHCLQTEEYWRYGERKMAGEAVRANYACRHSYTARMK